MEFKGTKGEWEVKQDSFKVWIESPLWSVSEVYTKDTQEEQVANAQLIAAAPELLEALQDILELCDLEDYHGRLVVKDNKKQKARQAINKALNK